MERRLSRIVGLWFLVTALSYGQITASAMRSALVADGLTALQRLPGILSLIHVLLLCGAAFALFFAWPYRFALGYLGFALAPLAGVFPPLWSPTPFQVGSPIWWATVVAVNLVGLSLLVWLHVRVRSASPAA